MKNFLYDHKNSKLVFLHFLRFSLHIHNSNKPQTFLPIEILILKKNKNKKHLICLKKLHFLGGYPHPSHSKRLLECGHEITFMKIFSVVVIKHSISIPLNVNLNTKTNSFKCKLMGTLVYKILPEYYMFCSLFIKYLVFFFLNNYFKFHFLSVLSIK